MLSDIESAKEGLVDRLKVVSTCSADAWSVVAFRVVCLFGGPKSGVGRCASEIGRFTEVGRFIPTVAPPLLSPMVSYRVRCHMVNYLGRKELLSVTLHLDSATTFTRVRPTNYFVIFELSYQQEDLVSGIISKMRTGIVVLNSGM